MGWVPRGGLILYPLSAMCPVRAPELLLLLCAGIRAKGASERLLCQRDGLGWFERELAQRYICGPKEI